MTEQPTLQTARTARYLATFLLTLGVLVGLALLVRTRLPDFRDAPIDFYSIAEDAVVIEADLSRRQSATLKLAFAEKFDPPEIGLFGNHQFQFFGKEAFGPSTDRRYYFNYWYANLGLPELRDYLTYLAERQKLPAKTILVQITTPNNDNGRFILGYNGELPADLVKLGESKSNFDLLARVRHKFEEETSNLYVSLQYTTFILGVFGSQQGPRILRRADCDSGAPKFEGRFSSILERMPLFVRFALKSEDPRRFCAYPHYWKSVMRPDGSIAPRDFEPGLNENPLREVRGLEYGDNVEIADLMRQIDKIGRDQGRQVIFVIPPVYETHRPSIVDDIFSNALARVPGLNVVDHRHLPQRGDKSFFNDYDHPSSAYFSFLVKELRQRGLVGN